MITVIKQGLLTTIQDLGRWGYQAYGMPVAGAMDRYSYCIANILVGNDVGAAAVEMTMLGAAFRFDREAWVSICGADMQATLNGEQIKNWSSFFVPAGSELVFANAVSGCRSYLAVHGGIDVPLVLESRSTYTRAGIGGINGRALKVGDILNVNKVADFFAIPRSLPVEFIPDYQNELKLRVLLGPQDDLFTAEGIFTLFNSKYTVTDAADRMGYRLEGAPIEHSGAPDIVSDALCQGAIQVPGHGMPIVMMADRQTTGGYAKIGTVIGPDLTRLAQAKPGDVLRFIQCSDDEAVAALKKEQDIYNFIADWAVKKTQMFAQTKQYKISVNGHCYYAKVEEVK